MHELRGRVCTKAMLELSRIDLYEGQSNLSRNEGAQGDGFELGFWQFEAARPSPHTSTLSVSILL